MILLIFSNVFREDQREHWREMGKYIIEWLLKVTKVSDNLLTKGVKLVLLIGEDQQMQNLLPAQQKSELFF